MNIQIIWILSSTTYKDGIMYKLKGKELEERNKKKKNKKKKIEQKLHYKDPEMFGYAPMSSNF